MLYQTVLIEPVKNSTGIRWDDPVDVQIVIYHRESDCRTNKPTFKGFLALLQWRSGPSFVRKVENHGKMI